MKKLTMPIATTVPPTLAVRDRRAESARSPPGRSESTCTPPFPLRLVRFARRSP